MKKNKKAASILLSMVIVLGLMPMSVFADLEEGNPSAAPTNADQIGKYYEANDATGALRETAELDADSTQQSYANGQVLVNKTISPTGMENLFSIDLEVITKNKIEQKAFSPDAAVVLVIDVSGSMEGKRIENAKTAAQTFINSFAADDENVQRKVAIVKFSGWKDKRIDGAKTVQSWTDASTLKRDGNARCEVIQNLKADGGTNIAAGLRLAKNLLNNDKTLAGITNKNVVLLTDGNPTYGMEIGADTSSSEVICPGGKDMIGNGQSTTHRIHGQVESEAKSFDSDISRYAVYVGIDNIRCTDGNWATCDLARYGGKPVSTWLREACGFTTMSTTDADQLTQLFESIIQMIEIQAQAWILTDPMGEYLDVVDPELPDYNSETREMIWDLKTAPCAMNVDEDGNTTYTYSRSYQVRLNNLKPEFVAGQEYPANGVTSLTYTISQSDETEIPELKTAYFNIPSVKGFAGDLEFTKVDDFEQPLAGAGFTLKADDGVFSMTASSGADGKVSFANIPSGHRYTLEETTVPEGYQKAGNKMIEAAFGAVSGLSAGATIKNTSERTSVTVNKIWEDNSNQDGKRPDSIRVQLYANNEEYGDPVTITAPQTSIGDEEGAIPEQGNKDQSEPAVTEMQALSEEASEEASATEQASSIEPFQTTPTEVVNTWAYTWNDLPKYKNGEEIAYTVKEVGLSEDYIAEIVSNGNIFTITNKYKPETTSYTVEKTWQDADNQDGRRPASIKVQLYADGVTYDDLVTLTAGEDGKWTYTWEGLLAFADGKRIEYTVDELEVPDGYTKTVAGSSMINTHTPATINIPVTKVWDDNNDAAGKRPESVTVDIKNGNTVVATLTLNSDGDHPWTATAVGLPWYENGKAIDYTVEERPVPGYICEIDENATKGFTVTNTYKTPDVPVYPPYIPPVVPTPDPVDPQPLPPDEPLEDPEEPAIEPQPLPPDEPLEDPGKDLPDDVYLQEADAEKNPKQPKTGDESPLVPLTGLLLLSAGALGAIYIKRKKED